MYFLKKIRKLLGFFVDLSCKFSETTLLFSLFMSAKVEAFHKLTYILYIFLQSLYNLLYILLRERIRELLIQFSDS